MKKFGKLTLAAALCFALGATTFAGPVILSQPPDQSNGIFSDVVCDFCGGTTQVLAVPFVTPDASSATGSIKFWGGYFPNNVPVADSFTIRWLADAVPGDATIDGPGALISGEVRVGSRVMTGLTLFGVDEWEVSVNTADVALPADLYWLEIYNNTGAGTDDFFWEAHATPNPDFGAALNAFAFEAPGATWSLDGGQSLAVLIREADALLVTMESLTGQKNQDGSVTIDWTTANETNNAGFKVVRAVYSREKAARAVYEVLTPQLIPAAGNTLEGASYSFTDIAPPQGRVNYYVFDVDNDLRETQHGPVVIETRTRFTLEDVRVETPNSRTRR